MSTSSYGPAEAHEHAAMISTLGASFSVEQDVCARWLERAGYDNLRVLREADRVVGCLLLIPMGIWYGGRRIDNMGIAGVAVAPERRGRGVAAALMSGTLEECQRRGVAVSTLYPSTQALYRKVGYELAGSLFWFELPARRVDIFDRSLEIREASDDDLAAIRELQSQWTRQLDGSLDRGDYVWARVQAPLFQPTRCYVVEEGGQLTGYVFLQSKTTGSESYDLMVTDVVATTPTAARRILSLLADQRSLGGRITWCGGAHDPLLAQLPERAYEVRLREYWMLRVCDVSAALTTRGYPPWVSASLDLTVDDDVIAANRGGYRLTVSGGQGQVERLDTAAGLRVHVRGLAALYGQAYPARILKAMGWLDGDEASLAAASAIFSGPPSHMDHLF